MSVLMVTVIVSAVWMHVSGQNFHLSSVDRSLLRMLSNPPKGRGDLLLNTMKLYINTLQQVLYSFRMRDRSVYTIVEILWEKSGPRFLAHPIDDNQLKSALNWDTANLASMYELLNKAEATWIELRREYANMLSGIH